MSQVVSASLADSIALSNLPSIPKREELFPLDLPISDPRLLAWRERALSAELDPAGSSIHDQYAIKVLNTYFNWVWKTRVLPMSGDAVNEPVVMRLACNLWCAEAFTQWERSTKDFLIAIQRGNITGLNEQDAREALDGHLMPMIKENGQIKPVQIAEVQSTQPPPTLQAPSPVLLSPPRAQQIHSRGTPVLKATVVSPPTARSLPSKSAPKQTTKAAPPPKAPKSLASPVPELLAAAWESQRNLLHLLGSDLSMPLEFALRIRKINVHPDCVSIPKMGSLDFSSKLIAAWERYYTALRTDEFLQNRFFSLRNNQPVFFRINESGSLTWLTAETLESEGYVHPVIKMGKFQSNLLPEYNPKTD